MQIEIEKIKSVESILIQKQIEFEQTPSRFFTTDLVSYPARLTIFPKSISQLKDIVVSLAQMQVAYHVVSSGHNWGYGDINLNESILVLIHLKFLDSILEYNSKLGTLVVQPGVTQDQVAHFLKQEKSDWVLDITGSDKSSSVMGNFLERGFGHSSHGDHETQGKIVQMMKSDGEMFAPNLVSSHGSQVKGLYQHDVALNLEKIFYQTHLAIATEMLVKLKPKNQRTEFCIIMIKDDHQVESVVQRLGHLKALRVLSSTPHIANAGRVQKTTSDAISIGAKWVATIDMSGPKELVAARRKILKKQFPKETKHFFTEQKVGWVEKLSVFLPAKSPFRNQIENLASLLRLFKGEPIDSFVIKSVGSTSGECRKMNWLGPLFPSSEGHFSKVKTILDNEFKAMGFSFSATISLLNEHCCVMVTEVLVPMGDEEQQLLAQTCYEKCHERLWQAGYPLYRYGLRNSGMAHSWMEKNKVYLEAFEILKKHFDPQNLISRGRWGFLKDQL